MPYDSPQPHVAILGLGNTLLMDDGVGVHAARELAKAPPSGVSVHEVGTAILSWQTLLQEMDVVVAIDAVQADGPPGSLYRFDLRESDPSQGPLSIHDLGIQGVLRLIPEPARPEVIVLGVEPERMDCGMQLTPVVHAALAQVVTEARQIAEQLVVAAP